MEGKFFEILYDALKYINLIISFIGIVFYLIGAHKAKKPWKFLKYAFALNLTVSFFIYVFLILELEVSPIFIRSATTLLIFNLMLGGFLGKDHER